MITNPSWKLFFDGSCEPINPGGTACYGWLLYSPEGVLKASAYGIVCKGKGATNNVAEFHALLKGLDYIVYQGLRVPLLLCGDSQLVVKTVSREWKLKKEHLIPLRDRIHQLLRKNGCRWEIQWIPREQNQEADTLCSKALA
jgi:ribonuclease HI